KFNNQPLATQAQRKASACADQRLLTSSRWEVLGGNDVGWRPARDHAYFLALIAPLADCHSDFFRSSECADRRNAGLRASCRRDNTVRCIAVKALKATCPKRTHWDRDSGVKGY